MCTIQRRIGDICSGIGPIVTCISGTLEMPREIAGNKN